MVYWEIAEQGEKLPPNVIDYILITGLLAFWVLLPVTLAWLFIIREVPRK
jgi:hypothetical protein